MVQDRRELLDKCLVLWTALQEAFEEETPGSVEDAFSALHGYVAWGCPIHPEADMDLDFSEDGDGCLLCNAPTDAKRSNGLRRHHERRKADGQPIVPPRRRDPQTGKGGLPDGETASGSTAEAAAMNDDEN